MIVYRFANKLFSSDLSGEGARLNGGRWNAIGLPVLYTSSSISLSLLEILVNTKTLDELNALQLIEVEIPDTNIHEIKIASLKADWNTDFDYSIFIGTEILKSKKALLIKCPSAIVQSENNWLINPLHTDFKKVKLKQVKNFVFDERLFKHNK